MATIDLGKIKMVWRGTYAGGTAYVPDDVVQYTDGTATSSYICTTASTGNAPSSSGTVHGSWAYLAKGQNASPLTTRGDIIYRDASADQRLPKGTTGHYLRQGTNDPYWDAVSPGGTYTVHKIDKYNNPSSVAYDAGSSGRTDYIDISGGNTLTFSPTSTNDYIVFHYCVSMYQSTTNAGASAYVMMKAGSASIGSGDTKIDYYGQHEWYGTLYHHSIPRSTAYPCTGLNVGTTYYCEIAGGTHGTSGTVQFNHMHTNASGIRGHHAMLIHYKKT